MMRTLLISMVAVGFLVSATPSAEARPRPSRAKKFEANKTFGLGLMLGGPSGLSGKYYLSRDTALDFGIGAYRNFGDSDRDGLSLHGDFLWHPAVLAKTDPFWLALYFGLGARYLDHGSNAHEHLGVRAPVGLLFDFERIPIDIFIEFALIADLILDDNDRRSHDHVDFNAMFGARYYF